MHALQTSGRARSSSNGNSLYTPTFDASDKEEEEVESSDPDLSDYYSDSGYPTLPRPRLVLWTSRRNYSPPRSDDGQRKAGTPPPVLGQKLADSSRVRSRHRKLPASSPTTSRETSSSSKGKAFSKLRSLRNNRILPASSPENERPPSTLVTTCISANGKSATQTVANSAGHPKQLRSVSLPTGDSTMAQAKQKKSKKPNRALSFSFGSGDKKKRARSLFGSIGRGRGEIVTDEQAAAAPQSPVLIGRRLRGTKTIYEEDRGSLSSVEEEEERMNSLNYLHGNRFGSCRELTSAGLSAMTDSGIDAQPQLRPLSKKRHKRPSLPNFAKHFPGSHSSSGRASPQEERRDRTRTDSVSSQVSDTTPPGSATSSPTPSRQRVRIRKLSDPGSAPSTPEAGNSPLTERRAAREDGGVVRGSRPLRKGFTFSVGVGNLSPDWKEMRHHVVRFLLETEQSYVQSLRTIIKVYYEPLKRPQAFGLIDSSLVEDIFYQIPEICSLHERFLLQISQRTDHWHPLQKIGDVFVNTFSKCHLMNIYTKFIHNFMRAKAAIEIAKQARPVFAKFLERAKYSTGKLSLDDLLIKPVQRIPRYLLFIKDLLKHTSTSHPDHAPLQQALGELTGLAERVNESEREMARVDQQRELLASVDGLALFVRPESELVRYDLVTETQGSAYKRDRFLILFSDVLVCASTRRKSTGLRRSSLLNLNTVNPDSFRYKIKWSTPLKQLSLGEVQAPMVERKKKNTLEKMIENLSKDEATLVQLLETSNTLRKPHQTLTSVLKDMLAEVRESIAEKKAELENLPLLHSRVDLMCYSSLPPIQYSILFPSQKIRNSWEEDFRRVKQVSCAPLLDTPLLSSTREGAFEFLHPLHVQSGRLGMELTCAGVGLPVDSDSSHNLWVACCDGYGGQVCLLDLHTSTRPHMVANITVSDSKILCVSAVPTEDEADADPQRDERESPIAASFSVESEIEEQDIPVEIPLDSCAEGLESGLDVTHPGLDGKTSRSMPPGLRGSLVASFSSDSSSTGTSVSRTPSINSTRSEEPKADPCSDAEVVGVASDVLDAGHTPSGGFEGHAKTAMGGQRKKNGFHRVCSNSAPDLLKVVAESSPTGEVFRRHVERVVTSLSPPPPVDSKFWSPLTLHPGPLEGNKREASEGRRTSMWLGTEGGQILVYSPGSSLRSRSNRTTICLPSAVHCIRYHRHRVFAGLADGRLAVLDPQHPAAGHTHLINISSAPIVSCLSLGGRLYVASHTSFYQINTATMEATPVLSLPENQVIQCVEGADGDIGEGEEGGRAWVSVRDRPLLHLYHIPSSSLITSVDCSQKLHDIFRGYNPITRQNKTSSLRITSLLLSHRHLLIGTSTGVVLTLPLPLSSPQGTSPLSPPPLSHLPQGHVDSASFLCHLQCHNSSLILSGGTGYENFATSHTNPNIAETASCLLIWRLIPQQDSPD